MDCFNDFDSPSSKSSAMFRNSLSHAPSLFTMLLGAVLFFGPSAMTWAVPGCTNPLACNFDPLADEDDGSCDYLSCLVFGCTNPSACNFNPDADYSDGSCEYSSCAGCMNTTACDYDPDATIAGPCNDFTSCYGCTDPTAPNYDPDATFDNGSCEVLGCTVVRGALDGAAHTEHTWPPGVLLSHQQRTGL